MKPISYNQEVSDMGFCTPEPCSFSVSKANALVVKFMLIMYSQSNILKATER